MLRLVTTVSGYTWGKLSTLTTAKILGPFHLEFTNNSVVESVAFPEVVPSNLCPSVASSPVT